MSHFILKDKPAAHPQPDTARPAAAGSSISLAPADGKTCGATYPRAVATGLVIAVCLPPRRQSSGGKRQTYTLYYSLGYRHKKNRALRAVLLNSACHVNRF